MEKITVLQTMKITNFDLLKLINGGTIGTDKLFSIRCVREYETKTKTNRPLIGLQLQIITNGIDDYIKGENVLVKKVKEKVIVEKEVQAKIPDLKQGKNIEY